MGDLITFLATAGYIGYFPVAPGTAGSVVGLILGELIFAPLWTRSSAEFLPLFAILFLGGCLVAGAAERQSGTHDDSHIVIDEIFGMVAAIFLIPGRWPWLIAALALFRALDVIKPWPASYFDAMHGGAGVMLDDLIAAIYTNLALQIVRRVL
jgi:phosphatidylglycerophosphatase A